MKRILALLAVALFALALAGCGETVLDATKTEEQIKAEFERTGAAKIKSVDCPSDVEVEAGAKFDCTVVSKEQGETVVTLKITNDNADLEVVDPGNAFDQPGS